MNKREFLTDAVFFIPAAATLATLALKADGKEVSAETATHYDPSLHWYGMGIDTSKCT